MGLLPSQDIQQRCQ